MKVGCGLEVVQCEGQKEDADRGMAANGGRRGVPAPGRTCPPPHRGAREVGVCLRGRVRFQLEGGLKKGLGFTEVALGQKTPQEKTAERAGGP